MATITVDVHLCANVPRGIEPNRGAGFQTFACGKDVASSLEFRELEKLVCYRPIAAKAGAAPALRETFVLLASKRYAVGRTGFIGAGADGQPNHLTRHLICDADALDMISNDAFLLIDEIPVPHPAQLCDPRALAPEHVKVTPTALPFADLLALPEQLRTDLTLAVVEGSRKPIMLVGGARQRNVMRALLGLLPADDRLKYTFDTLHVGCEALRDRFKLVGVPTHDLAPAKATDYAVFELEPHPTRAPIESAPRIPATPYGGFVLSCLASSNWPLLNRYQMLLTTARRGIEMPLGHGDAELLDLLWSQEPDAVVSSLCGHADRINSVLPHLASRNAMAHALLAAAPPSQLVGQAESGTICGALIALRDCVPPKAWLAWGERHANDPLWRKDTQIAALRPRASFWKKLTGG